MFDYKIQEEEVCGSSCHFMPLMLCWDVLFCSVDWYPEEIGQHGNILRASDGFHLQSYGAGAVQRAADLFLGGSADCDAFFDRNIRVAVLPCSESTSCLFRTRVVEASDNLVYNEVFWVSISYPALRQKTLRVDVCTVDKSHLEECLVSISLCFNTFVCVSSFN